MKSNIYNKNFLITGGTGQVGSFLTEELLKNGANVTVIGRNMKNLKEIKNLVHTKKINFIECDLMNEDNIKEKSDFLQNIDFLVHLSSQFRFSKPNEISSAHHTIGLDIKGIIFLIQQLKKLEGILFASSVAVYGKPADTPVNENFSIKPITFYGCGKFAAEKYLKLHCNNKNIPLTILRISTIYGQRDRSDQMIPIFIEKALKNEPIDVYGKSLRDFVHISDVIRAIISGITLNQNKTINIGTGKGFSNHFILKEIIEITKSKSKIIHHEKSDNYNFVCDNLKAIKELGFVPTVLFEKGLEDEITWYKNELKIESEQHDNN